MLHSPIRYSDERRDARPLRGTGAGKAEKMAERKKKAPGPDTRAYPSGDRFLEKEREELDQRWKDTVREMMQILRHVPDIRVTRMEALPGEFGIEEKKWLSKSLFNALLEGETRPQIKRSVVRRMADKMGQYLLWNRLSSTPGMHEFYALFPWWVSQLPLVGIDRLRDMGLAYVLNGVVLPIQTVWKEMLESRGVYMGHCVCRSSGIAHDLPEDQAFHNLLDEKESELLVDRITDCYQRLKKEGDLGDTDPAYGELLQELEDLKKWKSARYRLERLLRRTYPDWEFLPVQEKYTTDWIRSMYHNRKARPLHRELALELATILYFSHGIVFTTMRLFDTPYTICSCPTPERGGGCVLTNWYYFGQSNASLLPNEEFPGRHQDPRGFVLPCRFFETRAQRECLGCGCMNDSPEPRNLEAFLREADRLLGEYRNEKS